MYKASNMHDPQNVTYMIEIRLVVDIAVDCFVCDPNPQGVINRDSGLFP